MGTTIRLAGVEVPVVTLMWVGVRGEAARVPQDPGSWRHLHTRAVSSLDTGISLRSPGLFSSNTCLPYDNGPVPALFLNLSFPLRQREGLHWMLQRLSLC